MSKEASLEDIKKGYRAQAILHHPDKHSGAREEEKRQHQQRFQDVAEAFTVLSDTKARWEYDNAAEEEEVIGLVAVPGAVMFICKSR